MYHFSAIVFSLFYVYLNTNKFNMCSIGLVYESCLFASLQHLSLINSLTFETPGILQAE